MPVYLALQPIRCAPWNIAVPRGGLLPRLFTLAGVPRLAGGCFLSHYSAVADSFPLRNMVLYVARTFLTLLAKSVSDEMPGCIVQSYA